MKNNKGFSLVELIIVIAIMAVLIGVLAPQFIKYVERSRESTDLQNIEEIKTAAEAYVADNGETIPASSSIVITIGSGAGATIAVTATGITDLDDASKGLPQYGVTMSQKAKSSKWSGWTWTYDCTTYKWTASDTSAHADYFMYDGSAKS